MGKNLINHNRCPDCGACIKHYYTYCGRCGNNDVVNWKLTGYFWMIASIIFIIAIFTNKPDPSKGHPKDDEHKLNKLENKIEKH